MRGWLGVLVVASVLAGTAPEAVAGELRTRKSVTALTDGQKARFVRAVKLLKASGRYEKYVQWHVELSRCDPTDPFSERRMRGHSGPAFLPWHRQMLLEFEDDLREVSGEEITLPYWDWTDHRQASLDEVFGEDFMGPEGDPSDGYIVKKGPFRADEWKLVTENTGVLWSTMNPGAITRNLGDDPALLPSATDVEQALARPEYDVAPYDDSSDPARSFRNALEGWVPHAPHSTSLCGPDGWNLIPSDPFELKLHNLVHDWVGGTTFTGPDRTSLLGTMLVVPASPNDPVFFLHHAMVDRIWALWQQRHPGKTYVPAGDALNGAGAPMTPFGVTPSQVEDTVQLGYHYADPPKGARSRRAAARRTALCRIDRLGRARALSTRGR